MARARSSSITGAWDAGIHEYSCPAVKFPGYAGYAPPNPGPAEKRGDDSGTTKKYRRDQAFFYMNAPGCSMVVFLALGILCSGCVSGPDADGMQVPTTSPSVTSPVATPPGTPVPPATVATTIPVPSPTTEPVTPLPPERQVNLVLTKDRPTS